ncbi:hypothetical protein EJ576_23855 [Pseudomonas sp. C 49-2]|nr:hypothetical protein EJ576_23855 [Pseudomonas sp. C 49-2]
MKPVSLEWLSRVEGRAPQRFDPNTCAATNGAVLTPDMTRPLAMV